MKARRLARSRLLLITALLAMCSAAAVFAADDATDRKLEDLPRLTVVGEATLEVPADQLELNLGVVTEDASATEALERNAAVMRDVVRALHKIGLTDKEYQSGRFRLRPRYSARPRNAEPGWQPQITGYEVINSIAVKTTQLDLAGKLVEAANAAGANTIDNLRFTLKDERTQRRDVITQATRNARSDALAMASAADLRLVRILNIRLSDADVQPGSLDIGRKLATASSGTPLDPGALELTAKVVIVYEIAPLE
jgi:uncharacterized protein YggE